MILELILAFLLGFGSSVGYDYVSESTPCSVLLDEIAAEESKQGRVFGGLQRTGAGDLYGFMSDSGTVQVYAVVSVAERIPLFVEAGFVELATCRTDAGAEAALLYMQQTIPGVEASTEASTGASTTSPAAE